MMRTMSDSSLTDGELIGTETRQRGEKNLQIEKDQQSKNYQQYGATPRAT